MRALHIVSVCLAGSAAVATRAVAEAGVRIDVPAGWAVDSPPPHPSLVAAFRHASGARAVVAVEHLREDTSLGAFARANADALAKMRFLLQPARARQVADRAAIELRMRSPDDQLAQVQVYVVTGALGYVATLTVKPKLLDRVRVPFEELLAAMRLP